MTLDTLPDAKDAATLFVRNGRTSGLPVVHNTFDGCARLLKGMWPPEEGSTLWIECMGQKFDGAWINAHFGLVQPDADE
ncbi:hypothetical protein [Novosphingobium terrae]|uniref:hypothetical protein n=1 Tax=Novosphingobium terrae TaxID=2726189 RepID=UPI00197E5DE5|nr:hypothetical protein [Novosphingobium terrae]